MAAPNLLAGNLFRLLRSAGGSPETFTFVCLAQTKSLTRTNQFEDATVPDCAVPTSIPARKSILRSTEWALAFSGIVDAQLFATIETDFNTQSPHRYQLLVDKLLAAGGGSYTGAIWFESLVMTSTNGGLVNFTATCRGDDALVYAAAAA
jgi:hypothetical protein